MSRPGEFEQSLTLAGQHHLTAYGIADDSRMHSQIEDTISQNLVLGAEVASNVRSLGRRRNAVAILRTGTFRRTRRSATLTARFTSLASSDWYVD